MFLCVAGDSAGFSVFVLVLRCFFRSQVVSARSSKKHSFNSPSHFQTKTLTFHFVPAEGAFISLREVLIDGSDWQTWTVFLTGSLLF